MNLKNDVILITSHTPCENRRELLKKLILSIDRKKFDIIISSNTPIPWDFHTLCDFLIYDSSNPLIFDFDKKIEFFMDTDSFYLHSSEVKSFNHIIAAQSLITNGLNWAKNRGYTKLHFLEYDSDILDDSIFIENSIILDKASIVWYEHPAGHGLFSSYSVNIKKLPGFWFDLSLKDLHKFMDTDADKIIEKFGMCMIRSTYGENKRDFNDYSSRVRSNLFNTDDTENWGIIVADREGNFYSFVLNNTKDLLEIIYILNDKDIINIDLERGAWNLRLIGRADEIKKATIISDGKIKSAYDFRIVNKEKFIEKNFIRFKGI